LTLDGFFADLVQKEQQINKISDLSSLAEQLETLHDDLQAYYNKNINEIKGDVFLDLEDTYKKCDNKYKELHDTIDHLKTVGVINNFSIKLCWFDSVYKQLEQYGKLFLENESQKSLDSIKSESLEVWGTYTAETQEYKKMIEENPQLKSLCDTIITSKKRIDALTIEKSPPILDYIWKIALVLALAFLVFNMIRINIKTKKVGSFSQGNDKKKKTPSI
jgi:hypothetical protein